jgi:RsmE family RNA methyltransferase
VNLLLLDPAQLGDDGTAHVRGADAEHVRAVLGKGKGDTLKVGVLGGLRGSAEIVGEHDGGFLLQCTLVDAPPPKRDVTLVLALPRPPVFRRLLQHTTALGVRRILLCQSARVEKSYWGSPALGDDEVAASVRLGLAQAGDTVPPVLEQRRRFRPMVEDELAAMDVAHKLVADPTGPVPCPCDVPGSVLLAIGPEGGWVPDELVRLSSAGFAAVHLGPRVLRCETAVVAALARLGLG